MKGLSGQAIGAGLLAAFVGFASTFTVIVRGLTAVGATQAQAASGLMTVSVLMGVVGVALSLRTRQPISVAWSTPGAALLVTSHPPPGGFPAVVGAFVVTGLLIVLAGQWRLLGRMVAAIPTALASAMLAGIMFSLCVAPVLAIGAYPVAGLAIVATWALVARVRRVLAIPAAVLVAAIAVSATTHLSMQALGPLWPQPVLVMPSFSAAAAIGLALPLFVVTMASQNIPGLAVLTVNGYRPDSRSIFTVTGLASIVASAFSGVAVNLAAITAAMCAGPDAHPDPERRYWASVTASLAYIVLGLGATAATAFISVAPPLLIEAVAGLALLGAFGGSMMQAMHEPREREAAAVTFLVTGSGVGFLGISGAFWGLLAGGAIMALTRWRGPRRR